jgi:hypothetical protein
MLLMWEGYIDHTPGDVMDVTFGWSAYGGGILGQSENPITQATAGYDYARTYVEDSWRQGASYGSTTVGTVTMDIDAAGYAWNFGAGAPTSDEIDFRSVISHEIAHWLGFTTTYSDSTDTWWDEGITRWDSFLIDEDDNVPAADSGGTPGDFNELDNPVYFTGPLATAANGGTRVEIYAPASWEGGSSLVHVDELPNSPYVMKPAVGLGIMSRQPTDVELAMLNDLGWTTVPEPATLGLLTMGGLALVVRRRRRRVA